MNNVLYIGPDNKNHRGGIGAVLDVYSKNIHPFKFIPTYVTRSFPVQVYVYLTAILKLFWIGITDREIKILHIHHASRGSFLRKSVLLLIGKLLGKKVILHIHGGGFHNYYRNSRLLRSYIRFILEKADAIICLSENWRTYYSTTFKLKHLEVINNVIEKPLRSGVALERDSLNLLFLGHVTEKKGVFDLLDVMAANKEELKDKITVTIGGIGDVERLQKTIADNHTGGEIEFAGWVNGSRKAQLLNNCDVYVLPSYNEGLPVSVLEAMSYGKPVISTTVGGIPEIVKPGYNGWLFKPGDHQALITIIREVLENKDILKEYGNNSLLLSRNYTPESVFRSLDLLYSKIINS